MIRPPRSTSAVDPQAALAAGQCVVRTHQSLVQFVRAGKTLAQIDSEVARILTGMGARSCFKGYRVGRLPPFPSHACLSLNDCIVHGTAGSVTRPLIEGDVLKIDIGVFLDDWVGDAAWTYSIGEPTPQIRRLMDCGKECLRRGIAQMNPGVPLLNFAQAVQNHAETECGFFCTHGLGGHGIGKGRLHGPPFVANALRFGLASARSEWPEALTTWKPGDLVAVEPMLAIGTREKRDSSSQWPISTADGSIAVHYEADVHITQDGHTDLTAGLDELPDVL